MTTATAEEAQRLLEFAASDTQRRVLQAIAETGTTRLAAKKLGCARSTVFGSMKAVRRYAAIRGYSPEHDYTRSVPEGFVAKGVSTYYDKDGNVRGQWVKSSADQERRDAMLREAYEAMAQELPRSDPVQPPRITTDHLATLYTLTDCHVGMRAWSKETGVDWDLRIAEDVLVGCFEQMVRASPPASIGFVNQLGDFLHYDSLLPMTPMSGHIVDADSRYSKMAATGVRIIRRVVAMALEKHSKVVLLLAEGNHDMSGSVWLRVMFKTLYEREPRIEVIDSERPYYAYQHGRTMLAFHHGHLKKKDQLPLTFAAMFPEMWGGTTRRYAHTGHLHHADEREHSGMTVIQHPTITAPDSYASRHGYIADRTVQAITYHCDFGQVARHTVVPEMLV